MFAVCTVSASPACAIFLISGLLANLETLSTRLRFVMIVLNRCIPAETAMQAEIRQNLCKPRSSDFNKGQITAEMVRGIGQPRGRPGSVDGAEAALLPVKFRPISASWSEPDSTSRRWCCDILSCDRLQLDFFFEAAPATENPQSSRCEQDQH